MAHGDECIGQSDPYATCQVIVTTSGKPKGLAGAVTVIRNLPELS
jgi:hypothetical protein